MAFSRIQALMNDYDLEIDDIRWYLSVGLADEIFETQPEPLRLVDLIWSGTLADRLHDMEERWLEDLEERLENGFTDEGRIREMLSETRAAKRRRR